MSAADNPSNIHEPWQLRAQAKNQSITASIPREWLVDPPDNPAPLNFTGEYIRSFLTPREVEITETDAVGITEKTTTGEWTAEEVTRTVCRRAAVAHCLVRISIYIYILIHLIHLGSEAVGESRVNEDYAKCKLIGQLST